MKDSLENAKEELKRIDHLIYVTLKYTRTVDVLASVVERMINAMEFAIDSLLKLAIEQKKADDVPDIPLLKAQKVKEVYTQKIFAENIDRYLMFRKLIRCHFGKKSEYRRHVTLSAIVDEKIVEINIDNITEMFHSMRKFIDSVSDLIKQND
ncbi:MAG: hypothetical protein KKF44_08575 [Nanoarchaeota archaeon]|nr:hypothetical protein [Nanoarchaeota archaeon]